MAEVEEKPYSESYVDWMLNCGSVMVEVGVGSLVA